MYVCVFFNANRILICQYSKIFRNFLQNGTSKTIIQPFPHVKLFLNHYFFQLSFEFEEYLRSFNYSFDGTSRSVFEKKCFENFNFYICVPCQKVLNRLYQNEKLTENNIKQHIQSSSHAKNISNPTAGSFNVELLFERLHNEELNTAATVSNHPSSEAMKTIVNTSMKVRNKKFDFKMKGINF